MRSKDLLRAGAPLLALLAIVPLGAATRADTTVRPDTGRYVLVAEATEARYRVREQLARIDFPSDAVGKTNQVEGQIVLDARGAVLKDQSKFTLAAASFATDSDRRDNYVRRNTLQTEQFASITFVPSSFTNLRFPLPASGEVKFQIVGDLTIRDQTKPVTWEVTARVDRGTLSGLATTKFTFADFSITKPRVGSVLSVDDDIRLELDFRMTPAATGTN